MNRARQSDIHVHAADLDVTTFRDIVVRRAESGAVQLDIVEHRFGPNASGTLTAAIPLADPLTTAAGLDAATCATAWRSVDGLLAYLPAAHAPAAAVAIRRVCAGEADTLEVVRTGRR